jgi:hypothetical protein
MVLYIYGGFFFRPEGEKRTTKGKIRGLRKF